jgi:hypothetical protein
MQENPSKKKPYKIRKAKPTDVLALLELMKESHIDAAQPFPPVDDMDCINWILNLINLGGVWIAIVDKKIAGSIGCSVDTFSWNRKSAFVGNEWYYVRPQYRKGYDIAKQLIKIAKQTATEAKLPFIFSINSGKDKRIDLFVERQGFQYMGGMAISWAESEG